jgi:PAS domain S-box-containing protein
VEAAVVTFDRGLLCHLADLIPDAVIVADREGTVEYWNAGAERIFGYRADQAVGSSLDLIVPERLQDRHWAGFRHAVETGASRYGPGDLLAVPAQTADGRRISIEFTVALLRDDGRVTHVAAILRDVTERWEREMQLRRRLAELEGGGPTAG